MSDAPSTIVTDPQLDETTDTAPAPAPDAPLADDLVEDVSIDGMCGVY